MFHQTLWARLYICTSILVLSRPAELVVVQPAKRGEGYSYDEIKSSASALAASARVSASAAAAAAQANVHTAALATAAAVGDAAHYAERRLEEGKKA